MQLRAGYFTMFTSIPIHTKTLSGYEHCTVLPHLYTQSPILSSPRGQTEIYCSSSQQQENDTDMITGTDSWNPLSQKPHSLPWEHGNVKPGYSNTGSLCTVDRSRPALEFRAWQLPAWVRQSHTRVMKVRKPSAVQTSCSSLSSSICECVGDVWLAFNFHIPSRQPHARTHTSTHCMVSSNKDLELERSYIYNPVYRLCGTNNRLWKQTWPSVYWRLNLVQNLVSCQNRLGLKEHYWCKGCSKYGWNTKSSH